MVSTQRQYQYQQQQYPQQQYLSQYPQQQYPQQQQQMQQYPLTPLTMGMGVGMSMGGGMSTPRGTPRGMDRSSSPLKLVLHRNEILTLASTLKASKLRELLRGCFVRLSASIASGGIVPTSARRYVLAQIEDARQEIAPYTIEAPHLTGGALVPVSTKLELALSIPEGQEPANQQQSKNSGARIVKEKLVFVSNSFPTKFEQV
jgi:hypothetical protein